MHATGVPTGNGCSSPCVWQPWTAQLAPASSHSYSAWDWGRIACSSIRGGPEHKQNTGLCWKDPLTISPPSSRLLPEHPYTPHTRKLDHVLHCAIQFWHWRSPSVSELQVPFWRLGGLVLLGLLAFLCFDSYSAPCSYINSSQTGSHSSQVFVSCKLCRQQVYHRESF